MSRTELHEGAVEMDSGFVPRGPNDPDFERVDRLCRSAFKGGMAMVRRGELEVSPLTLATLESIEKCGQAFTRIPGSAFIQEGAYILACVYKGDRS